MEWRDVAEHLIGLAHLATVRPDGRPHVAIVSPQLDGATVWIAVEASSSTARCVLANPTGALVWSPTAEAYVDVDVEVVHDPATKERLWDGWAYDPAAFFGTAASPDYVLLRCSPVRAMVMTMGATGPSRRVWKRAV